MKIEGLKKVVSVTKNVISDRTLRRLYGVNPPNKMIKRGNFLAHVPTLESRAVAQSSSGLGMTQGQIATLIGIGTPCLLKHYGVELALGKSLVYNSVANALYKKAMEGDTVALIWLSKAQLKWTDKTEIEQTGSIEHTFKWLE